MARSPIVTWLPLDRWFEIIGIHPFHANQLSSATYLPPAGVCGLPWFQSSWQNSDRVGRDDIARAIQMAERKIADEVGYNLIPDWIPLNGTNPERLRFTRPGIPELWSATGRNIRGQYASVELERGYVISGGVRLKDGIETASVSRSDSNGDLFLDLCTVSVGVGFTDPNEVRVYYPGESGADEWEIRPINVSIASNVATITFNVWQIVNPDLQTALDADLIDAETATNFLTTVDVYRVRNDPQTQVTFLWEEDGSTCYCGADTCPACQLNTQTGCFYIRNNRLGIVAPAPGTWSPSDQQFTTQDWTQCRSPDQALLHYYSGWIDGKLSRPYCDMDPYWEYAVAYYAASFLDRDTCDCSNVTEFIHQWRTDIAHSGQQQGAYDKTLAQLAQRLGTTKGAKYAYDCITQPGRRIGGR